MEVTENLSFLKKLETQFSNSPYTPIGTQGLKKRVIQKGISWKTPFPGDEVQVHYSVGFEEGEYFDSSRDRGTPFSFKLGQCEVIKGWDEGIATMKKGERSIFIVPPELGYGEIGSPPLIPPNSTLVFEVEMVSWYTIKDISGDGGILKKIIVEGEGWATPRETDEVLVKYEARLDDGTIVSKSHEGVEFCISNGHLCPAMSKAVKTMRNSEKAELSVKFSYGFGKNENGNNEIDYEIPPNSNLIIDLELISWKNVIDITGDKKVLKKIIKAGEGFDRPNEGSLVKVMFIGKFEDGTIFERKGSNEDPFEYICGEEQIYEGLEKAIMSMKKREQAVVTVSSDYLCGYKLAELDSANSEHLYEVQLIDFIKEKPFWKMDTNEKLEACERMKNEGNVLFKEGKFRRASMKYVKECNDFKRKLHTKYKYMCKNSVSTSMTRPKSDSLMNLFLQALKYVEFDHSFHEDDKCKANALRLSCNLNNAACKLKLGEYLEASRLCTKVLEHNPINVKALFRRSQAYLKTSDLEKAEADIKQALLIDPNNRDVKLEYKELKERQKQHFQYESKIFSTMLSRMV